MSARERILPPLRALSLFAGIGGLDLGLEAHGCTTVAYSEIDPYAASIMALRFPDAVNLGDITTIDWNEANEQHGPFDIICGGFPCQDISLAGAGAGIVEGSRSGLWRQYADAIRILRPRGVLVENVAALTSRGVDRVLGDLAACGFDAEWDCVPAAAVGAPHLRDRIFVLAYGANDPGAHRRDDQPASPDAISEFVRKQPVSERGSGGEAQPGRAASAPADAAGERRGSRRARRAATHAEGWLAPWPTPNAASIRRPRPWQSLQPVDPAKDEAGEAGDALDAGWWSNEPDVARVGHGIPHGVDRRRALGNAVVPAVAEHVAGILLDRMEAA